ncbi:MAG: hypothetical protein IAI50_08720 [Candidatus Eremiobacteraeota bacterium]|nr:hypothetical protein [Candidatus Eremiobacteraeota bacterium]
MSAFAMPCPVCRASVGAPDTYELTPVGIRCKRCSPEWWILRRPSAADAADAALRIIRFAST